MLVERRTRFDPATHGFAFPNSWSFDQAERVFLKRTFRRYAIWGAAFGALFLGIGAIIIPLIVFATQMLLERHLGPLYGLCGGMSFVALDCYMAGISPAQLGADRERPAPGTALYKAMWRRQMHSLVTDGARFIVWLFFLNYVPSAWPFRGGPAWLLARSRKEWARLKSSVDAGHPVPIGLVRDRRNVYDNHQVLVFGYDELVDQGQATLYVYDPNCPGTQSSIRLEFQAHALVGKESCGADAPLRGFFCESYTVVSPGRIRARA